MIEKKCDVCGKIIPLGVTRYTVSVKILSGFDGFLPDFDVEEEEWERTLEVLDEMNEEDAEEDVHLEICAILCRNCRDRFANELKALLRDSSSMGGTKPLNVQ